MTERNIYIKHNNKAFHFLIFFYMKYRQTGYGFDEHHQSQHQEEEAKYWFS